MRPKNQLNRCSSEGLVAAGRTKENHQSAHAVMTRKKRNGDTVDTLSLSVAISAVLEQELDLSKPSHTGESTLSTPTHPSPSPSLHSPTPPFDRPRTADCHFLHDQTVDEEKEGGGFLKPPSARLRHDCYFTASDPAHCARAHTIRRTHTRRTDATHAPHTPLRCYFCATLVQMLDRACRPATPGDTQSRRAWIFMEGMEGREAWVHVHTREREARPQGRRSPSPQTRSHEYYRYR